MLYCARKHVFKRKNIQNSVYVAVKPDLTVVFKQMNVCSLFQKKIRNTEALFISRQRRPHTNEARSWYSILIWKFDFADKTSINFSWQVGRKYEIRSQKFNILKISDLNFSHVGLCSKLIDKIVHFARHSKTSNSLVINDGPARL